jgi:tRNA wybutosine-synthesizing protein 4
LFTHEAQRRLPLINRGYWARVHRIHKTLEEFLQNEDPSKQIISLGAGFDTTFFILKQKYPESCFTYIEIDFPDICTSKSQKIIESQELSKIIDAEIHPGSEIMTLNYKLLHGDLRNPEEIAKKLRNCTLKESPSLLISECVFCYIDSDIIDELINTVSSLYDNLGLIVYDIINHNDAFGRVMLQNLLARGIELKGIKKYWNVSKQIERYSKWFGKVQGFDMLDIYNHCVDVNEKAR